MNRAEDPKASPSGEQRRRALESRGWLTRDGDILGDRDAVLAWLADRGALPEMYRPPANS